MKKTIDQETIDAVVKSEAEEGYYLLEEYGLDAFLEMIASKDDFPRAIGILNRIKSFFEGIEEYEKCAYIRDIIVLLE
jgi:hypothetical protein